MLDLERLFDKGVRFKKAPKPKPEPLPLITEIIVFPNWRVAEDKKREFKNKGQLHVLCVPPCINHLRGHRVDRITVIRGKMLTYRDQEEYRELLQYAHYALRPNGILID